MTQSSNRLRIYALMGQAARLDPTDPTHRAEAGLLEAFQAIADVYYNNQKFDPGAPDWGLNAEIVAPPEGGYDLYYVRDNAAVFQACPRPRVTQALPHDFGLYYEADALLTQTDRLKRSLEKLGRTGAGPQYVRRLVPRLGENLPPLMHAPLTVRVSSAPSNRQLLSARAVMSFGDIVGVFGAERAEAWPVLIDEAYRDVRRMVPRLQLVSDQADAPPHALKIAPKGLKTPTFLRACVAVAGPEGESTDFLPSARIAEAIGAGAIVLAYRGDAHVEQLGVDYPFFYTDATSAARRLLEAIFDRDAVDEARNVLARRAEILSPAAVGAQMMTALCELLPGLTRAAA